MKHLFPKLFCLSFCTFTLFALTACPILEYPYPLQRTVVDTPDTCEGVDCGGEHTCVVEDYTSPATGQHDLRPACVTDEELEAPNG